MAAPDFSPITTAIDLSTVGGVIMAVAAIMAGIYVVWKGALFALRSIAHIDGGAPGVPFDDDLQKHWDYHHGKGR